MTFPLPVARSALPPGYEVRHGGSTPLYCYNPYETRVRLFCWTARGLNEFRDPDWTHVWAPDPDTALLLARQKLERVRLDPPHRMVDPPGLAHGSEAQEPTAMHLEQQFLRQQASRLMVTRDCILPVAKEDPRVAHWLAEFEATIDELLSLADAEEPLSEPYRGPQRVREMEHA